jgi:hypothetical protein
MVDKKRPKIAKKPTTPNPDSWVSEGGIDPEIQSSTSPKSETTLPAPSTNEKEPKSDKENEKTYPHRISFDMDSSQYKRLKWASFNSECPMNSILREAVEEWMKARNY